MPDNKPWLQIVGGTVMGLLTGSITAYSWLEHRIESRVEAKITTELRIKEVEFAVKANKDAAWTGDNALGERITSLQDRMAHCEGKLDQLIAKPTPVNSSTLTQ